MKIREVAEQLGYRPNRTAEFLKRGRIPVLGVFLPGYRTSLIVDLMTGISSAAAEFGFPLSYSFDISYNSYKSFLEEVHGQSNCGIISYPHFQRNNTDGLVQQYLGNGDKMVMLFGS